MRHARELAIALLAVAAVLSVVGAKTGERLLTALSFGCFALAALVIMRARRRR
jgi:hypothetical protein